MPCLLLFRSSFDLFVTEYAIPTLFKKYTQVGTDTARKYGGTGLGLAICKQLVSYHSPYLT